MAAPPAVKAFLTADTVIQDRATGKWTVVGVFDRIFAPVFPCVHPWVALYVRLSDAKGRYRVRIEVRDADDRLQARLEGLEFEAPDPRQAVEFGLVTQQLRLERPGPLQFQLFLNEEMTAVASLTAVEVKPGAPPPGP
ncbi:MAG TPA: hypothetical protein VEJ18_18305 [Planctomycetota bacterium]|nr:hypothetical protein [Planctomycetota bacterium]